MPDNLLRFTCPLEIKAAADATKPPRISIMAYSGGEMRVPGFGPVVINLAGLDTSNPVQILAEHKDTIDGLLGTGIAAKPNGKVIVQGTLTRANPTTEKLIAMSRDGVQFSASVGVQSLEREFVQPGNSININNQTIIAGREGLSLVRRGVLRETSIVALGADSQTSVTIAASKKGKTMSEDTYGKTMISTLDGSEITIPNEMRFPWCKDGLSDCERVEARLERFRRDHGNIIPDFGKGMIQAAASGSLSWADAEKEILRAEVRSYEIQKLQASYPKAPEIHGSSRDGGSGDAMEAALLCHLGHENISAKLLGEQATQAGRNMRLNSLHDILRARMQSVGMNVPAGREEMIRAAF